MTTTDDDTESASEAPHAFTESEQNQNQNQNQEQETEKMSDHTQNHSKLARTDWLELPADEQILWASRPTKWTLTKPLIGGLILILIGAWFAVWAGQRPMLPEYVRFIPLVFGAAGIWAVGVPTLANLQTRYVVTSQEVYVRQGIISRNVRQFRLDRIQNTACNQSILERALSFGTVHLYTAGTDTAEIAFESIPNPTEANRIITRALDTSVTPYDPASHSQPPSERGESGSHRRLWEDS